MQQSDSNDLRARPARDPDAIYLLDYLEIVVKRRRMIFLCTLAAALISAAVALSFTKVYTATARILPPQQDSGVMGMMLNQMGGAGMASLAGDLLGKGGAADLYARMLESEAVRDPIIDRFNVIALEKTRYRVAAYRKLDKKVAIETGKKDGIISITVDDKDPKRAADMANAYVEELGKLLVRLNLTGVSRNKSYLEERLAKVKADFNRASDALKAFQSKNKTLALPEQAMGTIKGVADLEGQLAVEEVKLAGMRRVFTDSSQDVKNQQLVVANIKGQIAKFEGNKQGGSVPGIGSVLGMEQEYMRLMREFKTQETLYELLTKQYELSKLSEAKDDSSLQVLQAARVPDLSVKPSRRNFVLMATAAAFCLSVILALVLEMGDRMEAGQRERLTRLTRQLVHFWRDV